MDFTDKTPEALNKTSQNTLVGNLGIEYINVAEGYVLARMPVDKRTVQPLGILHGGASLALAETVGGLGSFMLIDSLSFESRGVSLSANHLNAATSGYVYAEATIIHKGKSTHVWNIDIRDESGLLISTARLTNRIIPRVSNADQA